MQSPASEPVWETAVRRVFADHSQRYGTRRLRPELAELAHAGVGRWRIRRVQGLSWRRKKRASTPPNAAPSG